MPYFFTHRGEQQLHRNWLLISELQTAPLTKEENSDGEQKSFWKEESQLWVCTPGVHLEDKSDAKK